MDKHIRALQKLMVICLAVVLGVVIGSSRAGNQAVAQDQRERERASVTFTELNDSGLSGSAVLTARGQRTEVDMRIDGAVGVHPTHIHTGTCEDLDPDPKYPLNNVELNTTELVGMSDTVVDVPLDELLSSDHLILIHKSAEELDTYYACGNIVADTAAAVTEEARVGGGSTGDADASPADGSGGRALGNMGSGVLSAGAPAGQIAGLGLVGIMLALAAWTLRRRDLRG